MANPNIYLSLNTFVEKLLQWLFIKSHQNESKQASLNVAFQWMLAFQKDILNCKWDFEVVVFFFFFFLKEITTTGSVLYFLLNENWFGKECHSSYFIVFIIWKIVPFPGVVIK